MDILLRQPKTEAIFRAKTALRERNAKDCICGGVLPQVLDRKLSMVQTVPYKRSGLIKINEEGAFFDTVLLLLSRCQLVLGEVRML